MQPLLSQDGGVEKSAEKTVNVYSRLKILACFPTEKNDRKRYKIMKVYFMHLKIYQKIYQNILKSI